jgi:membrane protein required for beta-lactamase induction
LLGRSPLGELLRLLFALAVLLYCFGPREFEADLEAILGAPDGASREAAAQALADDGRPIAWNAPALGEAVAYAALRRRFAVLLWFSCSARPVRCCTGWRRRWGVTTRCGSIRTATAPPATWPTHWTGCRRSC